MNAIKLKTRPKKILLLFTIMLTVASLYLLRLDALAWHYWHSREANHHTDELNLNDYQVSIDAKPIEGISDASGLTYNPNTHTLFTILNQDPKIVELGLDGTILRTIEVFGVDDMEDITHIEDHRYAIVDERDNRVILIEIHDNTQVIDVTHAPKISIGLNGSGNKNFEGIAWDHRQQQLIVVKERDPKYVLSIKGLMPNPSAKALDIRMSRLSKYDGTLDWAIRDLSAVNVVRKSGHLLLLSDESKLIKELDYHARPVGSMALWGGLHGLKNNIPQAEGMTLDSQNNIYIMSEPNLFYVFKHRS